MTKRNPVHANEYTLNQTPNHAFFFRFALRVRRRWRPGQPSFRPECPLKREGAATAISNSSARAPATLGRPVGAPGTGSHPHGRDVGWVGRRGSIDREKLPSLAVEQSARGQETGRRQTVEGRDSNGPQRTIHPSPTLLHPQPARPSVRAPPCLAVPRRGASCDFRALFPTHPTVRSTRFLAWLAGAVAVGSPPVD